MVSGGGRESGAVMLVVIGGGGGRGEEAVAAAPRSGVWYSVSAPTLVCSMQENKAIVL